MDCIEGMKQLQPQRKYCIVTDPPFNRRYHYRSYKDKMTEEDYYNWLSSITIGYPCCLIMYPEALYKYAIATYRKPNKVVSWVYNSNTPKQHRDAAYFDVTPIFSQVTQPYKNLTDKRIKKRIAEGKGARCYDWMNVNQVKNVSKRANKNGVIHPCQMPEEVMRRLVGIIPSDYIIVDPFIGSGTTAIAAIRNNRNFIGFELDEEYYNIANERIQEELCKHNQ